MKRATVPASGETAATAQWKVITLTALLCVAITLATISVSFAQDAAQKRYPEGADYQGRNGCDIPTFFGTDNVACYNGAYYVIDGPQLRMLDENMEQIEAVRFYSDEMYDRDSERLRDAYAGQVPPAAVDEARLMVNDTGVFVMHAGHVYRFDHQLNEIDTQVVFDRLPRSRESHRRPDFRRSRYGDRYRTPQYYYPPGYNPRPPGTYYYDDRHDPRLRTPPGWYTPPGTDTPPGFYDPPGRWDSYRAPGQGTTPGWYETPEEREERQRKERHRRNPFRW